MIPDSLPQLSVGSHAAGSGQACIMNAISYINGDTVITDMPSCAHPLLAKAAIRLNDSICKHRDESKLLCSDCSHAMWMIGERIIGSASRVKGWNSTRLLTLYTNLRAWSRKYSDAAYAAYAAYNAPAADAYAAAAAYNAAAAADEAAAYAAYNAAAAAAEAAAYAAYNAADADAAYATIASPNGPYNQVHFIHAYIDEFERLTDDPETKVTIVEADVELVRVGAKL